MREKYKKSLKIINAISKIRAKNNKNWMDILKLAFKHDPQNASKFLSNITSFDKKISTLTKKLYKLNKK